jgi:NAD(P)-dependent dehydrogenase (short-subunit alcohol dehydrogenase family)
MVMQQTKSPARPSGNRSLEGQRVVIIGGTSGFGMATAKGAWAEGASVIVALEVTIGDKKFPLTSGESYFAPRNIPHRLRNLSQTPVRSLLLATPGGFDAFISQAGVWLTDGINSLVEPPTPDQMLKLPSRQ